MILRLTESDLRELISSTVSKILREDIDNNALLGNIVEKLSAMDIDAKEGSNDIEVPLDDNADNIAFITFEVEDRRYMSPGRNVPDYPDEVEGDYDVYVTEIVLYDEFNNEIQIQDNGMVASALKSLVNVGIDNLDYWDGNDDDQSGYNETWK